jgi:uncharacterized protein with von Willebrand factor type A (vWA) domain
VFAHHFEGVPLPENDGFEIDEMARAMLDEWLKNPKMMADALGIDEEKLNKDVAGRTDRIFQGTAQGSGRPSITAGSKWIGTGGFSPVGHSGYHPGGMRVGRPVQEQVRGKGGQ